MSDRGGMSGGSGPTGRVHLGKSSRPEVSAGQSADAGQVWAEVGGHARKVPGPLARAAIAAAVLLLPATVMLVGWAAAFSGADHVGWSVVVGVLGSAALVFALVWANSATVGLRERGRAGWAAAAVTVICAPGVAMWVAVTVRLRGDDHPASWVIFLVLAIMLASVAWACAGFRPRPRVVDKALQARE